MAVDADTGKSGIADAMMKWNKERHIKDVGEPSRGKKGNTQAKQRQMQR